MRFCMIGGRGVGKTSLINHFYKKPFREEYWPTQVRTVWSVSVALEWKSFLEIPHSEESIRNLWKTIPFWVAGYTIQSEPSISRGACVGLGWGFCLLFSLSTRILCTDDGVYEANSLCCWRFPCNPCWHKEWWRTSRLSRWHQSVCEAISTLLHWNQCKEWREFWQNRVEDGPNGESVLFTEAEKWVLCFVVSAHERSISPVSVIR